MRSTIRAIATLLCGAFLVAACAGAGATPTPAAATLPPASPTAAAATPTIAPTPTPPAMTDGQGPEHFTGLPGTEPYLEVQYTITPVGDVEQYRGGVSAWDFKTTDPRMQGHASFAFSLDAHGTLGPEWGTVTITNTDGRWAGTWTGKCAGGTWNTGDWIVFSCWLVGSGQYKGFSAYYSISDIGPGSASMEGIIFPGSPPKL
ncbi:MAG TPA: hypothetical protein VJ506_01105 [Candidatus Limnocylindrales bacterium]|nr:hypothetical protein [Candidatus Limnocylindrales bacterium]